MRVACTIAARLSTLGALTHGETRAHDAAFATEGLQYHSRWGYMALEQLYKALIEPQAAAPQLSAAARAACCCGGSSGSGSGHRCKIDSYDADSLLNSTQCVSSFHYMNFIAADGACMSAQAVISYEAELCKRACDVQILSAWSGYWTRAYVTQLFNTFGLAYAASLISV